MNNLDAKQVTALRNVLCELPDVIAKEDLDSPKQEEFYVPASHTKALGLDTTIVVGMRGAGKSVWTAALFHSHTRAQLTRAGAPRVLEHTHVRIGYSVDKVRGGHPDADTVRNIFNNVQDPRHIWRGILARQVADVCGLEFPPGNKAIEAARWAQDDPEAFERLLADGTRILKERGKHLLLVFDALERLSGEWEEICSLVRGALEVALACRSYPNIRLKFFLRPDMEEDPQILNFPDSSKLLHNKVELRWRPVDLYGLVFHILANGPAGKDFREIGERQSGIHWEEIAEGIYYLPEKLRGNEPAQRPLTQCLAGPYMGKNKRRGYTYTWIPTHLADAHGRIAPRSLLLALRQAADISREQYADHPFPLHYEAIKKGVAQASRLRVEELSKEDYPWVEPLLNKLQGITVPVTKAELRDRWSPSVLEEIMDRSQDKLPPRRYSSASPEHRSIELLLDDLEELGVLYRTEDDRINIPDIFRVGFGIRRKGGVRPPTRR